MLAELYQRIPKSSLDEIILADDGSRDNTLEVAQSLGIKSFTHSHRGYGGNIKFGFKKALELGGEYMVEIHGDGQYDPAPIPQALEKLRTGCDLLLGSRFTELLQPLRDGMSPARYFANIGLSFIDRLVLSLPLTEFHSGFRGYSRRLLETIDFEKLSEDYLFTFEIIVLARFFNLKICEIPIRCNYRKEHSSISIWKSAIYSFQTFRTLFQYILAKTGISKSLECYRRLMPRA